MADRLTYFLNKYEIAPYTQFGACKDSSTNDTALTLTHDIQNARNKGLVTTALTLDIKGYFNFVNHKNLLSKMRNAKLPLPMVKWMHTFLSERKAAIHLDGQCKTIKQVLNGQCKAIKQVLNGLPQGSPISGLASSLYTVELLQIMHKIAKKEHKANRTIDKITPMTMVMYIDDGNIWVSSLSLSANTHILQAAYKTVRNWLTKNGLSIDIKKCKLIHFTRRKKD
jgi:retron-type reverse transcriptase